MNGIIINKLMEKHGINLDELSGELYVKMRLVIEDIKEQVWKEASEEAKKNLK